MMQLTTIFVGAVVESTIVLVKISTSINYYNKFRRWGLMKIGEGVMAMCPHCYSEINFGATKCSRCTGDIIYDDKPLAHWKKFALIGAVGAPILDSYVGLGIGVLWSVVIGAVGAPLLLFMLTRSSGNKG